ncbi:MAG: hypothetical protein NZL92_11550 [Gloeomargarita sp. SKYG116]|nr:hypothetical protein [Gloeomargarita sp. SKYG116]MDW8402317.1 hypothetical protein [Gloeomargarita sp. SKYGB_i_bin116]
MANWTRSLLHSRTHRQVRSWMVNLSLAKIAERYDEVRRDVSNGITVEITELALKVCIG